MPPDVYRFMKAEFDALYPPSVRCKPGSTGCWQDQGQPDRLYAFSADGVFGNPAYSRSVTGIDFSDPLWLRLGFVNDVRYNWYTAAPDVHRADRNRQFWMGLWRWRTTMPWFVMYRFPADYAGSSLCWRGDVLWPSADGHYQPIRHASMACRTLAATDIGRQIFAVAIKPGSLAMALHPPAGVEARLIAGDVAALLAVIALLVLLVRVRPAETVRPFVLIGLGLMVIAIIDASFIGGWRPMDGGDDGLFYTGFGRQILQHLMHGDVMAALRGGESVYYYGGPGLRYWRALEMIVFGDTNLGYLSLVLVLPMIVLGLYKRFLSDEFAWRLALVFVAIPFGEIFGTSFLDYAKWAARGFADPAAQILLLWGVLVIVAPRGGAVNRAGIAAGGALLLALAVFTKPIVAPIPGIVLAGAGLAALHQRQWRRLAGMCIGFLPVLVMPLHNWYFGHAFVLLSSNACLPGTCRHDADGHFVRPCRAGAARFWRPQCAAGVLPDRLLAEPTERNGGVDPLQCRRRRHRVLRHPARARFRSLAAPDRCRRACRIRGRLHLCGDATLLLRNVAAERRHRRRVHRAPSARLDG